MFISLQSLKKKSVSKHMALILSRKHEMTHVSVMYVRTAGLTLK